MRSGSPVRLRRKIFFSQKSSPIAPKRKNLAPWAEKRAPPPHHAGDPPERPSPSLSPATRFPPAKLAGSARTAPDLHTAHTHHSCPAPRSDERVPTQALTHHTLPSPLVSPLRSPPPPSITPPPRWTLQSCRERNATRRQPRHWPYLLGGGAAGSHLVQAVRDRACSRDCRSRHRIFACICRR